MGEHPCCGPERGGAEDNDLPIVSIVVAFSGLTNLMVRIL